jgi:hypothetical protein
MAIAHKNLGKSASKAYRLLQRLGWPAFVQRLQHPIDISPRLASCHHSAIPYLLRLTKSGVPAPSSSLPWTLQQKFDAFARGPHPSASLLHRAFLHEDMHDMIQKGYWVVLPLSAVINQPHLKLAPAGVVPQRERRPRPIMDYTYNDINPYSLPLAPDSLQFGHTLHRILQRISYADPAHGPVHLLKLDLADVTILDP